MPSAVWPPSLPQGPRLEDLEETPPTLAIRTAMDVGPAKVRRRAVAGVTTWTMSVVLESAAQRATFREFFLEACEAGAVPFDWRNPSTGAPAVFRWVGVPKIKAASMRSAVGGGRYIARFTLEEMPAVSGEIVVPPGTPEPAGWRFSGDHEGFGGLESDHDDFENTAAGTYVSSTHSSGGPGVDFGPPKTDPLDPGGGEGPTGHDDSFDTNNPSSGF